MIERFRETGRSFFISVTLIDAAMLILGYLLRPQQQFGYEVFLYPLVYGLIGIFPGLLLTTGKELSVKQVVIRKIIQLLLIIILLLSFMFAGSPVDAQMVTAAACVAVSIAVIFVLVHVILWVLDLKTARSMTEDLMSFQKNADAE